MKFDDLDKTFKTLKRFHRVPPTKNLYVMHYNTSTKNMGLAKKIKNELIFIDPKAVVSNSKYVVEYVDEHDIGEYFLIQHCGKENYINR